MQSGGGVTVKRAHVCACVCVDGGDIMGCLPPDLFVCVSARARGVCSVRGERKETASCAHAATKTRKYI